MPSSRIREALHQLPGRAPLLKSYQAYAAIGGGTLLVLFLGLASGILAARVLGVESRGEFVATYTWTTVAAIVLTVGMAQAVVTYQGRHVELRGPLIAQTIVSLVLGGLLCVGLGATGAQPWLDSTGVLGGAAIAAAGVTSALAAGLAQRHGRMVRDFQYVRVAPPLGGLAVMAGLAVAGNRDANAWLLGAGLGSLLPAGVLFLRMLAEDRFHLMGARTLPRSVLVREAMGAFAISIGSQVIYRLDQLVVAVWLPPEKVALYAVAVAAGTACAAIGQSVGLLTFSELPRLSEPLEQQQLIRRSIKRALIITVPVGALVVVIAPQLIRIAYGAPFEGATAATRVMVAAAIPLSLDFLLVHALLATHRRRRAFAVQASIMLLTCAFLSVAVPTGNLTLIAGVSLLSYVVSVILLVLVAGHRRLPRPLAAAGEVVGESQHPAR